MPVSPSSFAASQPTPDGWLSREPDASGSDTVGLNNLRQLIQLRWLAVIGQVITIAVVHVSMGIEIPVKPMLIVLAALAAFNGLSMLRGLVRREVSSVEMLLVLLVDMTALTAQLYLSGGAANPFVFLYLLQVILGAVLLPARAAWVMVLVSTLCFAGLTRFAIPLSLPLDDGRGLASPYMLGLLICFVLNAALLVLFIIRIMANLSQRDARLAAMRQRAVEEELIVRMGLLASGAAHNLGTPLSTLDVILGDWRHLPQLRGDAELASDVAEMQNQVRHCKAIVSGILLSAGEARSESSRATTVCEFLNEVVSEWRLRHPDNHLRYENHFGQDLPMVSDSAVKQMMDNVLDNAFEASPHAMEFEALRERNDLVLVVRDEGPGFAPEVLPHLGEPYRSTKGRAGGGLGFFLVVNVARALGGQVRASNRPQGGAEVRIMLPLVSLALLEEDDQDDA
ncbi:ATP-binding protein [Ottowia thiooxydans]|uniref:ATP-binding protein n=1 Tax=Ottowia thiooxydans TaxID=219182 RepID=UPI00041F1C7A|nr:ATP-binding protein [Ottowia thiooxydans]